MEGMFSESGSNSSDGRQAAAGVAPRGLYLCGNASTTAGLTVSVVQDALTGDFGFEAGALVLADCGICCVDELDKLKADQKVCCPEVFPFRVFALTASRRRHSCRTHQDVPCLL
jgi:hypothetical protein